MDGQDGRRFPDSIGLVGDWRVAGPVWEIPYRTLIPETIGGLLVAGRCISAAGDAWEVTRVIPAAALTGQAAGVGAVLAVKGNMLPGEVPVAAIQAQLRAEGVQRLHLDELERVPGT